jgi:protein LTV1
MAPRKWIDKKTAETFSLVHRSQEDPLINDPDASQRVLVKLDNLNNFKEQRKEKWTGRADSILTREQLDLEQEQFRKQGRRDNEGEAALYGIQFDDSKYDYMQHLKPIGEDPSAVFIAKKGVGKKKQQSVDLLLKSDYAAANKVDLPSDALPSTEVLKRTYQDQQNIPDSIAGLQPDMDPDLREVLEALEDEEYVDGDEDIFEDLIQSGKAEERTVDDEWDDFDPEDYSDGYVSGDSMEKVHQVAPSKPLSRKEGEQDWEYAFRQFKIDQEKSGNAYDDSSDQDQDEEEERDEVGSLNKVTSATKKKKKKIGVKTDLTGFSMSSSALFRNEGLTLLDDRFDRLETQYEDDEEEEEQHEPFDMSKERDDLEDILDDFLDNYVIEGKKMYRK